jgi:hypothetical protein
VKIEESTVRKLRITEATALDPIDVILEDLGPRKGNIVITCYNKSWTAGWGGMGDQTIAKFFCSVTVGYIAGNLSTGIQQSVFDPDGLTESLQRIVLKDRRRRNISGDEARETWGEIDEMGHPDNIEQCWYHSKLLVKLIGDEWWYGLPEKPNPDYVYLCRIINAVQEALRTLETQRKESEHATA